MTGPPERQGELVAASDFFRSAFLSVGLLWAGGFGLIAALAGPPRAYLYLPLFAALGMVAAISTAPVAWRSGRRLWARAQAGSGNPAQAPVPLAPFVRSGLFVAVLLGAALGIAWAAGVVAFGWSGLTGLAGAAGACLGVWRSIEREDRRRGSSLLVAPNWGFIGADPEYFRVDEPAATPGYPGPDLQSGRSGS